MLGFWATIATWCGSYTINYRWEDINEYTQGLKQLFVELGVVKNIIGIVRAEKF